MIVEPPDAAFLHKCTQPQRIGQWELGTVEEFGPCPVVLLGLWLVANLQVHAKYFQTKNNSTDEEKKSESNPLILGTKNMAPTINLYSYWWDLKDK